MTTTEKLEALVRRAVEKGLKPKNFSWIPEDEQVLLDYWFTADNYKAVIFNHDFARALFGSKIGNYLNKVLGEVVDPEWKYHLQQAAISDNPIDYFYEVTFGGKNGEAHS